jgi:YD repeat-containing protein
MRTIYIILIAVFSLTSCKKTEEDTSPKWKGCKIVDFSINNSFIYNYEYDANGAFIKASSSDGLKKFVVENGNFVQYYSDGSKKNYTLNSKGFLETDYYVASYRYDADGYCTSYLTRDGFNYAFTYIDGSPSSATVTDNGRVTSKLTYEYYDNYQNTFGLNLTIRQFNDTDDFTRLLPLLYGKGTKRLPKKITFSSGSFYSFSYEFDGVGNITKIIQGGSFLNMSGKATVKCL